MALWPAGLPADHFLGTSDRRVPALMRTGTDGGIAKVRRRFTSTPRNVSGRMVITDAQRATFDTFFATTLIEGSQTFDWKDPVDGTTKTFRFLDYPNWVMTADGTAWVATMALELLP